MSHNTIPSAQPPARRNQLDVLEDIAASTAAIAEGGGGGTGGPDRELLIETYRANKNFTGATTGDLITATRMIDVSGTGPTQVGATAWFNESTQLALASAPLLADIDLAGGGGGATNAELVAALATQTGTKTTASAALPAGGAGLVGWLSNIWQSFFGVAHDTVDSGNPVKIGGRYSTTVPTLTTGNRGDLLVNRGSSLMVAIDTSSAAADAFSNTNAAFLNSRTSSQVLPISGNMVYNNATWDRMRGNTNGTFMQGNVADGAADAGNSVKVGGVFNTSLPVLTTGQRSAAQMGISGQMMVGLITSADPTADAVAATSAVFSYSRTGNNQVPVTAGYYFNGTTMDRVRGNTAGAFVQGNVGTGVADAGNPVKVGAIYNNAAVPVATGQRTNLQANVNGSMIVVAENGTALSDSATFAYNSNSRGGADVLFASVNMIYDGANYIRMRGDTTGLAVNTLKRPLVARQLAAGAASAATQLTAAVKRVSIYARGADIRFRFANATTTAVATDHFIAQGERLDLNCEVGATPWIAVIRDAATDGTLELSELS